MNENLRKAIDDAGFLREDLQAAYSLEKSELAQMIIYEIMEQFAPIHKRLELLEAAIDEEDAKKAK